MTIAFDFTLLHILNAKMSLFKVLFVGFNFDTILKSFLEKLKVAVWATFFLPQCYLIFDLC